MPQSLSKVYIHLVFSTKERRFLIAPEHKDALHAYIAGILNNLGSQAVVINSMPDHIHILFNLSRTVTIAKVVEEVKTSSSHWMKAKVQCWYGWQGGYASFSVSESQIGTVTRYITKQEEHHQKLSFKEELRALLKKHRLDFDERYLWD